MTEKHQDTYYIHGTSPEEQERLSKLNIILNKSYLKELNIQAGTHILDIGSGLGQLSNMMAELTGLEGSVLGIERDPDQLATAKSLTLPGQGKELNIHFRQGNALDLPLDQAEWASFDLVHTRFVLEHIPKPEQVINQMLGALRPGGRIVLSDDDHDTFRPTPEPPRFSGLWNAYIRSYDRMGNDPYIGRRLVSLLHQAGLTKIRNTIVFFGGCAGQDTFPMVAENLIGILISARNLMIREQLIDALSFEKAIEGLEHWKNLPDAALWYGICLAEGVKH